MKPCGWANACPHEATVSVRLAGIGDRSLCQTHYDWAVANGMDLRVLDPNAFVPAWKKRSLAKVLDHGRGVA